MSTKSSHSRGFTLIELLVVIAVIAILAAMLLPALSAAMVNSPDVNNRVADGHAEAVKLQTLWTYHWHLDWNPGAVLNPLPNPN